METITKIMYEMYVHREGRKTNYPEKFFDIEKKLLNTLSKEQFDLFLEYESQVIELVTNEQKDVFEFLLNVLSEH